MFSGLWGLRLVSVLVLFESAWVSMLVTGISACGLYFGHVAGLLRASVLFRLEISGMFLCWSSCESAGSLLNLLCFCLGLSAGQIDGMQKFCVVVRMEVSLGLCVGHIFYLPRVSVLTCFGVRGGNCVGKIGNHPENSMTCQFESFRGL